MTTVEAPARRKRTLVIAAIVATVLVVGVATATVLARRLSLSSCLVGAWRASANTTTVTDNGHVTSHTITGVRLTYHADGTTQQFYTDATARLDGDLTPLAETVTYNYNLHGDEISYTNGRAQGQSEVSREQDYTETADCSGNDLTLTGTMVYDDNSRAEWTITLTRD